MNERVVGLIVAVSPGAETEVASVMLPLRPRLFRLIVDDLEVPEMIVRLVGFAEIVKPLVMVRVKVTFRVMLPPVPVTVNV